MAKPRAKDCPIVGFMDVFGDYWSWLIVREAFYGATRFSEFQRNTGAAKNLLSARLATLVEQGVLAKRNIGRRGERFAYELTEKGAALQTILIAMMQWSNEHLYGAGREPVLVRERASGEPLPRVVPRGEDGRALAPAELAVIPGPAASAATKRRLAEIRGGATPHNSD